MKQLVPSNYDLHRQAQLQFEYIICIASSLMTGAMHCQSDCDNCNNQTVRQSVGRKRENRCASRGTKRNYMEERVEVTFISRYRRRIRRRGEIEIFFCHLVFSLVVSNRDESSSFRRCNDC